MGSKWRVGRRPEVPRATGIRGRVIVTGASSGVGEATARHLRNLGFEVVAGVRGAHDEVRLQRDGLQTVRLDVTNPEHVAAAVAAHGGQPLAGLVNNAGIMGVGLLEVLPLEVLRRQLEVNLIGQLGVTQAFLGALRAGGGRVVNVGSSAGFLTWPTSVGYSATKFALRALTDGLRRELLLQGVGVVLVAPGGVRTRGISALINDVNEFRSQVPPEVADRYRPMIAGAAAGLAKVEQRSGMEAQTVAKVIGTALTARRPRAVYLVGAEARAAAAITRVLPARVIDRLVLRMMNKHE